MVIKATTPLVQVLDEGGEPTGRWAFSGEVDGLVFHNTVPDKYTNAIDLQTYLEADEVRIKAKAEMQALKAPKVIYLEAEGFMSLLGTGIPEKIENIENFLTKMFPTRGI